MYIEAVLLAIPLFVLSWFLPLLGAGSGHSLLERLAMSLGAGIYEELIFRLVLISVVVIIGSDLLKFDRQPVAIIAIGLSSLIFAASHHRPFGLEPLTLMPLLFRSLAGAYLAVIFWFRGYGPAAGCHGAYNVLLLFLTK